MKRWPCILLSLLAALLLGCGGSHDARITAELDRADSLLRTSDTAAHSAALRQMLALDTARALQSDETLRARHDLLLVQARYKCYVTIPAASAYSDQKPYQRTDYEQSPLDRTLSVTGAGQAWHNAHKAVTTTYRTNDPSDNLLDCRRFSVTDTRYCTDTAITITPMGHYPKGSLHVTVTADEDGHTEIQFTDKQGRTVLTREVDGNTRHDTYHVYDAAGRLTAVLPPKLSAAIDNSALTSSSTEVRELAYLYIHDWQGRCRAKKLPGCSWRTMAYGKGGDAVLVQDGILRGRGKSTFRLADAFGRECVSGITSGNVTVQGGDLHVPVLARRDPLSTSLGGYVIDGGTLTVDGNDILQVNYYDDYDFLSIFTAHSDSLAYRVMNGYDNKYQGAGDAVSARGMLTGTATRVLNTSGNGGLLVRSMYYDLHGNLVQSHEQNHLGGYEHYYYHLTFTGKPLKVMHVHTTPDTTNTDIYEYTYDNMERLLTATVRHDGASAVTLCQNTYNSLGQLATHSLGSSSQGTISYTYNVRGWPTAITSAPFKQWLHYQDTYGTATPCWNGNVSAMEWESLDALIATQPARHSYAYTYDGLNRLTAAAHEAVDYDNWSGSLVLMNEPDYSCTYDYDLNGNITSLTRKGVGRKVNMNSTIWVFGEIDHLSMTYDGNRLRKATDQCAELTYAGAMDFKDGDDQNEEYTYDRNGNMTRDRNKDIYNITYNVLNLPERIEYYDGHEVQYTYAADGRKLHVEYVLNPYAIADDDGGGELPAPDPEGPEGLAGMAGTLTGGEGLQSFGDDPIEIEEPGEELLPQVLMTRDYCGSHIYRNGALERIENEYGFWADSCYHYRIADYQGNVRAVISQNGVLEEVNGYYPYGGITGAPATGVQPLKYGGKELDRENGLDWLDSQARMYDFIIGRTPTMDPMSEKYYHLSPYLWCAGNPVIFGDFDGEDIVYLNDNYGIKHVKQEKDPSISVVYPDGVKRSFADIIFGRTSFKPIDWHGSNRHAVACIYEYYAKQLGVTNVDAESTLGDVNTLAFTQGGTIWLSPNQEGKISPLLSNRYNLLNNIYHESLHQKGNHDSSIVGHLGVYLKMMKHETFKNTTFEYKKGQFGAYAKGLLLAYYNGDRKQHNGAIRMLKEFNNAGLGVRMRWDKKNKGIHIWINNQHRYMKYDDVCKNINF